MKALTLEPKTFFWKALRGWGRGYEITGNMITPPDDWGLGGKGVVGWRLVEPPTQPPYGPQ